MFGVAAATFRDGSSIMSSNATARARRKHAERRESRFFLNSSIFWSGFLTDPDANRMASSSLVKTTSDRTPALRIHLGAFHVHGQSDYDPRQRRGAHSIEGSSSHTGPLAGNDLFLASTTTRRGPALKNRKNSKRTSFRRPKERTVPKHRRVNGEEKNARSFQPKSSCSRG